MNRLGAVVLAACSVTLASCADARDLFRPYVPNEAEMREVLSQPRPAPVIDVAIALGCPANPDGSASLCERCRVKTAVRQYRAGQVRNLLFTGGAAHSPDVEADVMADLAIRRGVPPEHVFREGRALTTWQNLRFSERIARAQGFRTILFISTADHLPRVRRMARFYGIEDARDAFIACDLDLPPDSDEEFERTSSVESGVRSIAQLW
jgi:vancomycin permeability regulator SanA